MTYLVRSVHGLHRRLHVARRWGEGRGSIPEPGAVEGHVIHRSAPITTTAEVVFLKADPVVSCRMRCKRWIHQDSLHHVAVVSFSVLGCLRMLQHVGLFDQQGASKDVCSKSWLNQQK